MINTTINSTIAARLDAAAQAGRFIGVEYVKKDGTIDRMTVKPIAGGLAELVTVSGAQAAATRAANNPTLRNVQSMKAYRKARKAGDDKATAARKAWRSFYLDKVLSICVNGTVETFRIHRNFNP